MNVQTFFDSAHPNSGGTFLCWPLDPPRVLQHSVQHPFSATTQVSKRTFVGVVFWLVIVIAVNAVLGPRSFKLCRSIVIAREPGAYPYPWDTPEVCFIVQGTFQSLQRTAAAQGNANHDQNNDSCVMKRVHLAIFRALLSPGGYLPLLQIWCSSFSVR